MWNGWNHHHALSVVSWRNDQQQQLLQGWCCCSDDVIDKKNGYHSIAKWWLRVSTTLVWQKKNLLFKLGVNIAPEFLISLFVSVYFSFVQWFASSLDFGDQKRWTKSVTFETTIFHTKCLNLRGKISMPMMTSGEIGWKKPMISIAISEISKCTTFAKAAGRQSS